MATMSICPHCGDFSRTARDEAFDAMLEVCKAILSDAEQFDCSDRNKAHIGEYRAEQLRQAIAKAEGRND